MIRNRRWRWWGVALGVAIAAACDECEGPPSCDPCDAVAMLRATPQVQSGEWVVPDDVPKMCDHHVVDKEIEDRWNDRECPALLANYVTRTIDWTEAEASYDEQMNGSSICPDPRTCFGCCSASVPTKIVGPLDLCKHHSPAVAMLIANETFANFNETALAERIEELIDREDATPTPVFGGAIAPCTAFLVDATHVMTAQHCLDARPQACGGQASDRLDHFRLLFDYEKHPDDALVVTGITAVACGYDDPTNIEPERDWILLELDDALEDRMPLDLPAAESQPESCSLLYVLGYPLGHPQTCIGTNDPTLPNAWVDDPPVERQREVGESQLFRSNVDVLRGLSGAPVFDRARHSPIGMHRSGTSQGGDNNDFRLGSSACSEPGFEKEYECGRALGLGTLRSAIDPYLEM
jgi:hypothetical protein